MSELVTCQGITEVSSKYSIIEDSYAANGTSRQSEIMIPPALLRQMFGEPLEADGYKASGEYIIKRNSDGKVFTLYDWKSTNLYDGYGPSPEEFWRDTTPRQFNIGSDDCRGVFEFVKDMQEVIDEFTRQKQTIHFK